MITIATEGVCMQRSGLKFNWRGFHHLGKVGDVMRISEAAQGRDAFKTAVYAYAKAHGLRLSCIHADGFYWVLRTA